MRFVTTTFQAVALRVTKKGNCPVCGKAVQRSTKIENTVNPYNRNDAGEVKSFDEVRDDVHRKAIEWEPDFRHQKCVERTGS